MNLATHRTAVSLSAAVLAAAAAVVGGLAGDPLGAGSLPRLPWWGSAIGAVALIAWSVLPERVRRSLLALVLAGPAVAAVLLGVLGTIPYDILFTVVIAVQRLHPGPAVLPLNPTAANALSIGTDLIAVMTTAVISVVVIMDARSRAGVCVRCGRRAATPPRRTARWLPVAAAVSVAACLPYATIKLSWALGWHVGITGHAFDNAALDSGGFGDTVVLSAVSIIVSLAMAARIRHRIARAVLVTIGAIGSTMLLPIGVMATAQILFADPASDPVVAAWVFDVIYSCFLVWGSALLALTIGYALTTRTTCRHHHGIDSLTTEPAAEDQDRGWTPRARPIS